MRRFLWVAGHVVGGILWTAIVLAIGVVGVAVFLKVAVWAFS